MTLTLEQTITKHELADERRFGQVERHLERIEGKIDVMTVRIGGAEKTAEHAEEKAEVTGSYQIASSKNVLWIVLKSIGAVAAIVLAAVLGHYLK